METGAVQKGKGIFNHRRSHPFPRGPFPSTVPKIRINPVKFLRHAGSRDNSSAVGSLTQLSLYRWGQQQLGSRLVTVPKGNYQENPPELTAGSHWPALLLHVAVSEGPSRANVKMFLGKIHREQVAETEEKNQKEKNENKKHMRREVSYTWPGSYTTQLTSSWQLF